MSADINVMIKVLLDPTAEEGERDDVAMDLEYYPTIEVKKALLQVAMNQNEDDSLLDSCGESLAQIWIKRNDFNKQDLLDLAPSAAFSAMNIIKHNKPEWIEKYDLHSIMRGFEL